MAQRGARDGGAPRGSGPGHAGPAGLLAVDNVISHAAELVGFQRVVAADARVADALVPIGAGLLLAVRQPA